MGKPEGGNEGEEKEGGRETRDREKGERKTWRDLEGRERYFFTLLSSPLLLLKAV